PDSKPIPGCRAVLVQGPHRVQCSLLRPQADHVSNQRPCVDSLDSVSTEGHRPSSIKWQFHQKINPSCPDKLIWRHHQSIDDWHRTCFLLVVESQRHECGVEFTMHKERT